VVVLWLVFSFFVVLSFSSSCLFSSSLSEVWQFKPACCPQSGSEDQLCIPPAVLLWSWIFAVLFYWGLVSLSCPISLGQGQWSVSQLLCCQHIVMVCCLFLNPAEQSDFGCCSLAQEISLSPACCRPSCLSSHLFTDSLHGDKLLAHSPFSSTVFLPPAVCPTFQFVVQYFFFLGEWSVCTEAVLVYPKVAWRILHDAWHSPVWTAEDLPSRFGAGNWW
jgi:hypothetical protein